MNDQPQVCPKCGGNTTQLQGGLAYCSACGFEGEEKKPDPEALSATSKIIFWIALIAPAFLALVSFLLAQSSQDLHNAGFSVGFIDLFVDVIASLYCGWWLARRFCKPGPTRALAGVGLFVGITGLNFMLICAGCSGNLRF